MDIQTIRQLQHFVGKVCSVITTPINRQFDEKISREHFVLRVTSVSRDGIWGVNPYNDELASFIAMSAVNSIHNEVELDAANPEHQAMITEFEERTGKKLQGDLKPLKTDPPKVEVSPSPANLLSVMSEDDMLTEAKNQEGDVTFVDIASLERLAESTKRTYAAYDLLGPGTK